MIQEQAREKTSLTQDRLAIEGGPRAKTTPYTRRSRYGPEELEELRQALDQGSLFFAGGSKVKQLQQEFAAARELPHAVACSSGTASLHAALIALGISPGDEVITSPITDIGTVVPILWQDAVPVFADLDPHTYNLTPETVEAVITPATRAVIAVHLAGAPCDLNGLMTLCQAREVFLIEDCAQALGARYDGRPVGSFGDVGCFSLNEFKHIGCGDGGIAVTSDDRLGHRLQISVDKCYSRSPDATDRHPHFLANNYRMTELQGAVALAQHRRLPQIVRSRQEWCTELSRRLEGTPGICLPRVTALGESSWWFYLLRVQPDVLGVDATEFARALAAEGLPASAHYIGKCVYEYPLLAEHRLYEREPVHGHHPFTRRAYAHGDCPVAEAILDTAILLGINEGYSQQDLEETVTAIRRVTAWYGSRS